MIKIAPSILSANLLNLENDVKLVDIAGVELLHIDIMDGHYVPNITFGSNIIKSIRPITNKILDVHLMINNVEKFINELINSGADILTFHPENEQNPEKIIESIKKKSCKCGIAIHPDVKIKDIFKFINLIDIINVMTVMPGFAGQKFMENQIQKVIELKEIRKKNNLNFEIEIDGGINKETAKICRQHGADILVAGSYIYNSDDKNYKKLIQSLR